MSGEDEGLLARWSRLKRENAAAEGGEETPPVEAPRAEAGDAAVADRSEAGAPSENEPMLTEADLPDIEALTYESDFSVFMKSNVPLALQKRALRKLWNSNPVLANLDGLNDHDLDYTISEMKELAAQSAADLASSTKRLNVMDLRAKEREMRRAARQPHRPRLPEPDPAEAVPAGEPPREAPQAEAEAVLADYVAPPSRKLDS